MAEALQILILEDYPTDAELIQFELQEAGFIFTSKVVMTEEDFVSAIQEFHPDLILSDYDLPQYNGALALAEARRKCPETPFILVTGAVSEDRAIEILTQGAKDYVLKNRLQQRLVPAVKRALAEAEEHRARKQAEADEQRLLQELQVHQIELEMQNEELKRAQNEAETERKRYRDLYDFSPVGYFTLDSYGVIHQANLTGARMFGVGRSRLTGQQFRCHLLDESYPTFNSFLRKTFEGEYVASCEVSLLKVKREEPTRFVHLSARLSEDRKDCLLAMIDITDRKRVT